MMSKKVIRDVAVVLANVEFDERCAKMDVILADCLTKAFDGEKISKERRDRILDRFCVLMCAVKTM